MSLDSDRLRALLDRGGYSQRGAARELEISERAMRYYCSGKHHIPKYVMFAVTAMVLLKERGEFW